MMNEYQYRTLCGLGEALYKHCALIKRAAEAKLALDNTEILGALNKAKKVLFKAKATADKLSNNNSLNTNKKSKSVCTR